MSSFKRKPSGIELAAQIGAVTGALPAAVAPTPPAEAPAPKPARVEVVQVNFRASRGMARLIARLSAEHGSTRRMFARLLRDAGHAVPEVDLNPPDSRRRFED